MPVAQPSEAAREVAERFDPFHDPMLTDPYPFFSHARRATPVFYAAEFDVWVVTRHEDISHVFSHPEIFSATNATIPYQEITGDSLQVLESKGFQYPTSVFSSDPPYHTRIRQLVRRTFTPRHVAKLETFTRERIVADLDRIEPMGEADLVEEVLHRLPGLVMLKLLGFPEDGIDSIRAGSRDRIAFLTGRQTPEEQVRTAHGLASFLAYARELIEKRLKAPEDDLTSDLLRVRDGDDSVLSLHELTSLLMTFFSAGHETTSSFLGNAVYHLLKNRKAWEEICNDQSLIPTAVEELLRFDTSITGWRRRARQATELGGVSIPKDAQLLLLLGSAGRDESVFAEAEKLDVRRKNAHEHLAFGHGIHYCLGAPLARLESRVVLETLSSRLPSMSLVNDKPGPYLPSVGLRVPLQLRVRWDL